MPHLTPSQRMKAGLQACLAQVKSKTDPATIADGTIITPPTAPMGSMPPPPHPPMDVSAMPPPPTNDTAPPALAQVDLGAYADPFAPANATAKGG